MDPVHTRTLGTPGGMRVLSADVSIVCWDAAGALTPAYTAHLVAGIVLALLWSVGVPAAFGLKLYQVRKTPSWPRSWANLSLL